MSSLIEGGVFADLEEKLQEFKLIDSLNSNKLMNEFLDNEIKDYTTELRSLRSTSNFLQIIKPSLKEEEIAICKIKLHAHKNFKNKLNNTTIINSDLTSFKNIFNEGKNAYDVCIELLENLEITINGIPRVKTGRAGNLMGAIIAMKETPHFFKQEFTENDLLKYFNTHLGTNFKTLAKRSKDYPVSYDESKRFIKNTFKK